MKQKITITKIKLIINEKEQENDITNYTQGYIQKQQKQEQK